MGHAKAMEAAASDPSSWDPSHGVPVLREPDPREGLSPYHCFSAIFATAMRKVILRWETESEAAPSDLFMFGCEDA